MHRIYAVEGLRLDHILGASYTYTISLLQIDLPMMLTIRETLQSTGGQVDADVQSQIFQHDFLTRQRFHPRSVQITTVLVRCLSIKSNISPRQCACLGEHAAQTTTSGTG